MNGYDLWVKRDPKIQKSEWHTLVTQSDVLNAPNKQFGDTPEDAALKENVTEFVWWLRDGFLPSKISFIAGAVHIEAGDPAAWQFANEIAVLLDGEVIG